MGIDAAKIPLDLAFGTATWGGFKTHKLQGWEVFEEREPSEGSDPFVFPYSGKSNPITFPLLLFLRTQLSARPHSVPAASGSERRLKNSHRFLLWQLSPSNPADAGQKYLPEGSVVSFCILSVPLLPLAVCGIWARHPLHIPCLHK